MKRIKANVAENLQYLLKSSNTFNDSFIIFVIKSEEWKRTKSKVSNSYSYFKLNLLVFIIYQLNMGQLYLSRNP